MAKSSIDHNDELVTKADLSNFYQGILPYLGGMPDVLANKFNKSDLYSTDEKLIGRWIDGKPVYRKVVPFWENGHSAIGWTTSDSKWIYSDFTPNYFGLLIDVKILTQDASGNLAYGTLYKNNLFDFTWYQAGYFLLNFQTSYNNWLILTYTKTTDSSIEIGSDTDYSTDEKIVGTWIDGKPIYQKTFDFGTMPAANAVKSVPHGILNIDVIVSLRGLMRRSTDNIWYNMVDDYATNGYKAALYVSPTDIGYLAGIDLQNYTRSYVTIQYTKTTD